MYLRVGGDSKTCWNHASQGLEICCLWGPHRAFQTLLHVFEQSFGGIAIVRGDNQAVIAKDQNVGLGSEA